jgi:seryl-tRNA synthetase
MHDIKFIRDNPAAFDQGMARRHLPPTAQGILEMDSERRKTQTTLQELQAQRNDLSKKIGDVKKQGGDANAVMAEVAAIKDKMAVLETIESNQSTRMNDTLATIPNIPSADVPDGKDEKDNKELKRFGEPGRQNAAKQHYELGEALGLMDFTNAAKMSGARFTMLRGALAQLERALGNFMLDIHTREFGYEEISPPLMVRDEMMYGTAQLPKFRDDQFQVFKGSPIGLGYQRPTLITSNEINAHDAGTIDVVAAAKSLIKLSGSREGITIEEINTVLAAQLLPDHIENVMAILSENGIAVIESNREALTRPQMSATIDNALWLIPTAEVPLTNIVNGELLESEKLPFRYTARTPCFRAEAGAAGRDTRGMLRQHQFYKVEMVTITTADQSEAEHERMTRCAETVLERLNLPYRRMVLCAGDMGFAAKKTYDLEVWLPGQGAYREISSCSNCGDFQARRMNTRCRPRGEKNTQFVHTLNGSGVAVGRCLIAVMENCQNADGSITIPESLRPYMNGMERIT